MVRSEKLDDTGNLNDDPDAPHQQQTYAERCTNLGGWNSRVKTLQYLD